MIAVATLDLVALKEVFEKALLVARALREPISKGQFEPARAEGPLAE